MIARDCSQGADLRNCDKIGETSTVRPRSFPSSLRQQSPTSATHGKASERRLAPRFAVQRFSLCVCARERGRESLMGGLIKSSAGNLPPADLPPCMGTEMF